MFEALSTPARRRAALRYYRNNLRKGLRALFSLSSGAPVLYLLGEHDGCVHVEAGAAYAGRLAEGSRLEVVAGVGHFLQLEAPSRVNRLIGDWIGAAT